MQDEPCDRTAMDMSVSALITQQACLMSLLSAASAASATEVITTAACT